MPTTRNGICSCAKAVGELKDVLEEIIELKEEVQYWEKRGLPEWGIHPARKIVDSRDGFGWTADEVESMAVEARRKFLDYGREASAYPRMTRLWRETEVWMPHKVKNEGSASEGGAGASTKTCQILSHILLLTMVGIRIILLIV